MKRRRNRKTTEAIIETFSKAFEIRQNVKMTSKYTAALLFPEHKIIVDYSEYKHTPRIKELEDNGFIILNVIDFTNIFQTLSRIIYVIKQRSHKNFT